MYAYFSLNKHKIYPGSIYNAINKHGLNSFKLEILEYCEIKNLKEKEYFYITQLNPYYNINKPRINY